MNCDRILDAAGVASGVTTVVTRRANRWPAVIRSRDRDPELVAGADAGQLGSVAP